MFRLKSRQKLRQKQLMNIIEFELGGRNAAVLNLESGRSSRRARFLYHCQA